MALAALPLAERASQAIGKAVKADLVVINGEWHFRKVIGRGKNRHEVLIPVGYEFHVNPVTIGVGALAIGAVAALSWVTWNGVKVANPLPIGDRTLTIVPGMKDSDYWKGHVESLEDRKARLACQKSGGQWDPTGRQCILPDVPTTPTRYDTFTDYTRAGVQCRARKGTWVKTGTLTGYCKLP